MRIDRNKITKWLLVSGTLLLIGWLAFAGWYGSHVDSQMLCNGVYIQVMDTAKQKFVTADELKKELGRLPQIARHTPAALINTDSLARHLQVIDKIEDVSIRRLTDGSIFILVEPMRPLARVFEPDRSYYINKDGKRISADARYHIDVPVIQGLFADTFFTAKSLLPLIKFIDDNNRWSKLVSMIKVDSPRDIIIIPAIRGIVFNIGEPADLPGKFSRLERMIAEVLPVKGWNYYDTLSVKWQGQVVATRREKVTVDTLSTVEEFREADDIATMTVGDNVAVGQARPGKKAKNERPIITNIKDTPASSGSSAADSLKSGKKNSPTKK